MCIYLCVCGLSVYIHITKHSYWCLWYSRSLDRLLRDNTSPSPEKKSNKDDQHGRIPLYLL